MKPILKIKHIAFLGLLLFLQSVYCQQPELVLPMGHTSEIVKTAMSPDGKIAASASKDGAVILWRTSDWAQLKKLGNFSGGILCFSEDSKSLFFSTKGKLICFGIQQQKTIKEFTGSSLDETFVDIAPDASFALSLRLTKGGLIPNYGIIIWNLTNGISNQIHEGFYLTVAISRQGEYVAIGSMDIKNTLLLYNKRSESKEFLTFNKGKKISGLVFSNDGKKLLAITDETKGADDKTYKVDERKLFIYNLESKKAEKTIKLRYREMLTGITRDNQSVIPKKLK